MSIKKASGIYCLKNIITDQYYIGKTVNLARRKTEHFLRLKNGSHINNYLLNSYKKYGKENFEFEVICYCDINWLAYMEYFFYEVFKTSYNLFNLEIPAANGTSIISKETRHKISLANKGRIKTEIEKHKLSIANKNNKNCLGRILSEKTKRKISDSHLKTKINRIDLISGEIYTFTSFAEIRRAGYNVGNVFACCLGKRNKHKEYGWEYFGE